MNYGDEMNDDEEKSYRKELIEKRKRERREKEEAERKAQQQQPKSLPKRESRGKRMNVLVGKAIEEDENFWNQGIFAEALQNADEDDDFESAQESSD